MHQVQFLLVRSYKMSIKYTVRADGYVGYTDNGVTYSIPNDPANSDYQRYLEHLTENPTQDVE